MRGGPIYAASEDNVASSSRSTSKCLATRLSLLALCSAVNLGSYLDPGMGLAGCSAIEPRVLGKEEKAHLLRPSICKRNRVMTGRVRHVVLQDRPFAEVLTFHDAALGTACVTAASATLLLGLHHCGVADCSSLRVTTTICFLATFLQA